METKNTLSRHSELVSESSALSEKIGRSRNKFGMTDFYGFTLVELIVVITILVILGTIAFVNLGGYSSSARDSARVSDMTNITQGLELVLVKNGTVPVPEAGSITISASGTVIGYQWYAGGSVLSAIKMSEAKDPLDKKYYTYSTNVAYTKYEMLGLMEDPGTLTSADVPFVSTAYAGYETRTPTTKGSSLGILLGNTGASLNVPVQESYSVGSFTGVDVVNTSSGYMAVFGNGNMISGSGMVLKSMRAGGELANGLLGYWSFDEGNGNIVYDNSGKGNNGTLSGTTLPTWTTGKIGTGMFFAAEQIVFTPLLSLNPYALSVSSMVKLWAIGSWTMIAGQLRSCNDGFTPPRWNSWALSITSGGNIAIDLDALGNHYDPNLIVTTNMKITNLSYHFVSFSFNSGKLQINLDNQKELYDLSSVDFSNPVTSAWTSASLGTTGRLYNTAQTIEVKANFYDYTGNDYKNYLNGTRLLFDHFLKPETPVTIWSREAYCWSVHSYGSSNGSVDEVRIYNRALSDSEIQALYQATK